MSEDQLLSDLGRLAREENEADSAQFDERWDRLAAGTLTPEEEAELRALAETSPEAREIYEAFRPLGADFQARVVTAITGEMGREAAAPEQPETPSRPLPFRPRVARLGWLTAAGLAAASLVFFLLLPTAQLPTYTASLEGGSQEFRGATTGVPSGPRVFTYGDLLTLVAQPPTALEGPVEAKAFLERGGEIIPWEPAPALEIPGGGAVRLRGTVERPGPDGHGLSGGAVGLRPGAWKIWLVVGRPGDIPPLDELERELRAGRARGDDWQAMSEEVRVQARP